MIHNSKLKNKVKRLLLVFVLPLGASMGLFFLVHPTFAQLLSDKERLAQFVATKALSVGAEKKENDYSQIYYVFEDKKNFLTSDNYPHGAPYTEGENIVWMEQIDGSWQIFYFNVLTGSTIQLTNSGNNVNPKVSNGNVVWEGWVPSMVPGQGGNWQLFVYDGKVIRQFTQGDLATHPDIEGDYIVYARKNEGGLWRSEAYSIKENKTIDIDSGNTTEYPHLINGDIFVGPPVEAQTKYPLKVQDLFLVDLISLPANAQTVTPESIQAELNALQGMTATSSATKNP
jgi:hypothetical protein